MLRENMKVAVYDGDFLGWTEGILTKQLPGKNRWTIFTDENYELDRIIIEDYTEMKSNGCGYVIPTHNCPQCESYNIDDDNLHELICYDCDCRWNAITDMMIQDGGV